MQLRINSCKSTLDLGQNIEKDIFEEISLIQYINCKNIGDCLIVMIESITIKNIVVMCFILVS